MDPKVYNDGDVDREKLIKNQIDIEYLTHLIFLPSFDFDSYECLDASKLRPSIMEEFKKKQVEVILGFSGENSGSHFHEGDIAL